MGVRDGSPVDFLQQLQSRWQDLPEASELNELTGDQPEGEILAADRALDALRAIASLLISRDSLDSTERHLLQKVVSYFTGRPVRKWKHVTWSLDFAAVAPTASDDLLRTLIVSLRLAVKGDIPSLANLAGWGDATHELLPEIRTRINALFVEHGTISWVLFRQLAKTLPHLGAKSDELHQVRAAAEEIQWLLDCPLTMDIREETHSRASPANLVLARAYLLYLETGDKSGLAELRLTQKIPDHDLKLMKARNPEKLKGKLLATTRELVGILTRLYAFDPRDLTSVFSDAALWLKACEKELPDPVSTAIRAALDHAAAKRLSEAAESLVAGRQALLAHMGGLTPNAAMNVLYLDLELEKLCYLLFGEIVHGRFAELDAENIGGCISLLRAMIISEELKGHGSPALRWVTDVLLEELSADFTVRMAQLLVLNHQINDEISDVSLRLYRQYSQIVRELVEQCAVPDPEVAVNTFVDGLVRATTLQHLGELSLKIHHFVLGQLESHGENVERRIRAQVAKFHRKYSSQLSDVSASTAATDQDAEWVYRFRPGRLSSDETSVDILGGKGAHLCEMCKLGLPVPPGFVVSVGVGEKYLSIHALDPAVRGEIRRSLQWLEHASGKTLESDTDPLLVSVRSGAPVSMPGMLSTVLNVGMTDDVVRAIARKTGSEAVALELYVRFLVDYAEIVLTVTGINNLLTLPPTWESIKTIKEQILDAGVDPFWQSPADQIVAAVEAVFRSMNNPHAVLFRKTKNMPKSGGTAAVVQEMVFGNADDQSLTGVYFTRNPSTDEKGLFGEYLPRAQGADVVSGTHTPYPIQADPARPGLSLREKDPELVGELKALGDLLERYFGTMQEIEFTVERGELYILQTRNGDPKGPLPHRLADDLEEALSYDPKPAAPTPSFDIVARGLGASPGGVLGRIAFTPERVKALVAEGKEVIFVRQTTTPEDLEGMMAASGVLTQRGGVTSHAANNARYLSKPCVVGCKAMMLDDARTELRFGELVLRESEQLFIDGMTGEVGIPQVE